MPFDENHP